MHPRNTLLLEALESDIDALEAIERLENVFGATCDIIINPR